MNIPSKIKSLMLGAAILPAILWAKPGDPLTFKAIDQRTYVQLSVPAQLDPKPVFEYRSGESGEWRPYSPAAALYVNAGETVSIRAATNGVQSLVGEIVKSGNVYQPNRYCRFGTGDGRMEVSGDVTTLLSRQGAKSPTTPSIGFLPPARRSLRLRNFRWISLASTVAEICFMAARL